MAEGTLFSIASGLLSQIDSQPRITPFSIASGTFSRREDLKRIRGRIEKIQAVLLDAEERGVQSPDVDAWLTEVRDVLYRADDLLDELDIVDLSFRRQMEAVLAPFRLYRLIKPKWAIPKRLKKVCKDAANFSFAVRPYEEPTSRIRKGVGTGWSMGQDLVVDRSRDLESILGFLFDAGSAQDDVSIVYIVGEAGIGKTALAHHVYNTAAVQNKFEARWWASVSGMFDEVQIVTSVFQSASRESSHGLSLIQLKERISESPTMILKFLLVIDALEAEADFAVQNLRSLLTGYTGGSKILVTTSHKNAASVIKVDTIHHLNALSWNASWDLFKRIAFTRDQENDPRWCNLGRKILNKCGYLPLSIKILSSLLYTKNTLQEWHSCLESLQTEVFDCPVSRTLKLSYDYLPPGLKRCFAYCSLFPKDYKLSKDDLIRLWIAQGFVTPKNDETCEEAGDAIFKQLLSRFYFEEGKEDGGGEVIYYKMHALVHGLAQFVAKQESFVLLSKREQESFVITKESRGLNGSIQHLSVGYRIPSDGEIPSSVPASLRSVLFLCGGLLSPLVLKQLLRRFKLLRAIDLQHLDLEELPNSIGELLHLRYLNLSGNKFRNLPNSITKLLNLLSLDVSSCVQLEALPVKFSKLINLRHLNSKKCDGLRYMPPQFEALTSLQQLSYFKMGKVTSGVNSSRLDALGGLKLQGQLQIMCDSEIANWDEDECWSLPTTLQEIKICSYPGMRLPLWVPKKVVSPSLLPKLLRVHIHDSSTIKYLSPLRSLPYLKTLHLSSLMQLTYVEEEEDERESGQLAARYSMLFFPSLEELVLTDLPRLVEWSREVEAVTTGKYIAAEKHSSSRDPPDQMPSFPLLSNLKIENCTMLRSVPPSSCLQTLELQTTSEKLIQYLLSTCSHSLETIAIRQCDSLDSFPGETLTSLQHLELSSCREVKNLYLPQHNVLEELVIGSCPQLKLQELKEGGVDWDSLINLKVLSLDEIPDAERLSVYLRKRTNIGKLQIKEISSKSQSL